MAIEWQVECDEKCSQVLRYHYPGVSRWRDVREVGKSNLPPVDLITFGWPCQDLSIAGLRTGLVGRRSGLFWEAMRIIEELSPTWFIGENVPGLLSSQSGQDMGAVIRRMEELGYGVSWAMLDAQYFHLAQRRERLFFVGSLGDLRSAEILFEPDCGPWDTPPRREKGKGIAGSPAPCISASGRGTSRIGESRGQDPVVVDIAPTFRSGGNGPNCHSKASHFDEVLVFGGNRASGEREVAAAFSAHGSSRYDFDSENFVVKKGIGVQEGNSQVVAFTESTRQDGRNLEYHEELAYALTNRDGGGRSHSRSIAGNFGVRRLMPVEVERCFGFPDDWTRWGIDGKGRVVELSDSARYRMLGNSVAVPVVEWIGRRMSDPNWETGREDTEDDGYPD